MVFATVEAKKAYDKKYHALHAEEYRQRAKDWYASNFERAKERHSQYEAANKERVRERWREWYRGNKASRQEQCRQSYLRHKEAYLDSVHRRRARIKGARPLGERISKSGIYQRDGGICHICGLVADQKDWHLDHVIPLSRGGTHSNANVAVSHPQCNLSKGSKTPRGEV